MSYSTVKHAPADQQLIDSTTSRQLMEFRNYMFSRAYIDSNAGRFLENDWIDPAALRDFLGQQIRGADASTDQNADHPPRKLTDSREQSIIPSTRVKIESAPASVPSASTALIKQEPQSAVLDTLCSNPIKIRTLTEGGQEILEILSDTDHSDTDSDLEVTAVLTRGASRSSSAAPVQMHSEDDRDDDLVESDTHWEDGFTSMVRFGSFQITRKTKVQRIEYLPDLASIYPIFRSPTAIVIDLSDPKHELIEPRTNELHSLDSLVRNKDNDGWDWEGGSGAANYKPLVVFAPGEKPIRCRRAPVTRFELDPTSRNVVLAAQAETRRQDGSTPEQNVAIFKQVICNAKCKAVDSNGNKCQGAPIMKAKPEGPSRGHQYFIACSGFTRNFKTGHQTHSIPDNVDENQLAKALAGQPFVADGAKDTAPCSKFVPSTTGFKQQYCPHPHIVDGVATRSKMVHHECGAARVIYIPIDPSIRKVLIVTNQIPHNHPMPTLAKVPVGVMEKYKTCVIAHGGAGATVAKVDNAPSTRVLLGGKTPAGFSAGLHSRPVKAKIIAKVKRQLFPNGTDAAGVFSFYLSGLTKPLPERYIHGYITTDDGGICILTCVPYLLKLLDDPGVNAFDDDTTYKRIEGKMNEWELTILVKTAARAATVARAYINRASTVFFEKVFDELQRVKLLVTHKPMPLRPFVPGGNLDVMNADMDGAQILGICRSIMKHNVPEYSGIPNDTPPEQVAQYFVKVCWRHAKEPVHDFRSLVSPSDYARLLDFVYIDTKESLADFSAFVSSLGVKKIQDWWAHKEMHEWIIPCLVKSQSRIPADVWDTTPSTTNTNEAQHAWTNSLTGTGRSLAEGISAAYDVDRNVAEEIELTLKTGVFSNPHNEYNTLVFLPTPADIQHISDRRPIAEFESSAPIFHFNDSSSSDNTDNLNFLDKMLTWDFNMNAFDSAAPAFNFNDSSSSDSTNDLNFLNEMLTWDFNMNAVGTEYVLADNTVAAPVSELPTLPAPPPSSPLAIPDQPLSIEPLAATKPKQRREVDENNILNTRRRHIKRTRSSDNQLFDKPTKKGQN
ncbi:hypothetical protein B0H14DRAFT_3901770 [Mycena olivaceomarginata]|nr:hypothetical protein B0H14DRAFT_3901770 [Mycena olivaceomarginata]